jgi:hypothetical protein
MNNFKFHSVGQGLFYTGSLANKTFNFVYDCGTDSNQCYLKSSIDAYVNEIQEPKTNKSYIDFVVISHLHRDHFSGLLALARKTDIGKVYLPFLGHDKNLIALALAYTIFEDISEDFSYDISYGLFHFMCGLYGVENYNDYPRIDVEFFVDGSISDLGDGQYCYSLHKKYAKIGQQNYWEFVFVNRAFDKNKIAMLNKKVSELLAFYEIESIIDLVSQKQGIKLIANIYHKVFGDAQNLNNISIILLHYPLYKSPSAFYFDSKEFAESTQRSVENRYFNCWYPCECNYWGLSRLSNQKTILTGDVSVDTATKNIILSTLKQLDDRSKLVCGVLQVPHHGSKYNWQAWKKTSIDSRLNVISSGLGNSYGHPSSFTVGDLISHDKAIQLVNQMQSFEYYID